MHAASTLCDRNAAELVEWRGEHWWAGGEGKRNGKIKVKVRGAAKSRWKSSFFLLQSIIWFSPPDKKPYPTLRTASALGNGLKSKTGTTRIRAGVGRGNWLIVSAVSHCHMGKASILSGESVVFQGRRQKRAGFIAGSCKACRARDRVREQCALLHS